MCKDSAGGHLQSTRRRSSSGEDEEQRHDACVQKSILQQAAGARSGG